MTISMLLAQSMVSPDEVRARVAEAYRGACCSDKAAALALEVSLATYLKVVDRLGLRCDLLAMKERAKRQGWHHAANSRSPGRPRKDARAAG